MAEHIYGVRRLERSIETHQHDSAMLGHVLLHAGPLRHAQVLPPNELIRSGPATSSFGHMRHAETPYRVTAAALAGAAGGGVMDVWERLAQHAASTRRFEPSMTDGLPPAARRWLTHVISPGSRLSRGAVVEMRGHIRLGRWIPFNAVQLHCPPFGYVWVARARLGPLWISGFDRYSEGTGEMRWRLLSRVPVISAAGSDLDRSAAGRVALDAMLCPTAWLHPGVAWRDGDNETAIAEWHIDDAVVPVELRVGPDGALRSVTMSRWAQPRGHPWGEYPCGGNLEGEVQFDGITLGRRVMAGYFYGRDEWNSPSGEYFRAEMVRASFL